MKARWLRFWWVAVALLIALMGGAWWAWKGIRPRTLPYLLKAFNYEESPSNHAVKFAYAAEFQAQDSGGPGERGVQLTPIPSVGIASWVEDHFNSARVRGWNKSLITVYYSAIAGGRLEAAENGLKNQFKSGPGSTRRLQYRIGPAVLHDGLAGSGETVHYLFVYPEQSRPNGGVGSSGSAIIIMYGASAEFEPQLHHIVDDLVASIQIVPVP